MVMHVNFIFSQCNQTLYLLKFLRSRGFSSFQSDQVSQATIISWLRYALPVWSGFLFTDLINSMQTTKQALSVWLYYKLNFISRPNYNWCSVSPGSQELCALECIVWF